MSEAKGHSRGRTFLVSEQEEGELRIEGWNVNGLRLKVEELKECLEIGSVDVMGVVEIWGEGGLDMEVYCFLEMKGRCSMMEVV